MKPEPPKEPRKVKSVAITGSCGTIGRQLSHYVARGMMFGPDHDVSLTMIDVPQKVKDLHGLCLELEDSCYP